MAETSEATDRPQTIIVDLPVWLLPPLLPTAGVIIAGVGLFLRCFARWLAWPSEWRYTGERVNTVWAYRESLYSDLGLVALIFGLALVFLAIARATPSKRTEPR
jgi:hypothetical protein